MRLLVAYASKHESTAEIAQAIAEELRGAGIAVDLLEAGEVGRTDDYDAVVLGSAVYMKRWRPSARHLLRRLERELGQRPLWIFSSGPVGDADIDPSWCEPAGILTRAQHMNLRDHVIFGGRVPQDPRNFVERAMLRDTPPDIQDRREFEGIRAWARDIAESLVAAPVA
jgi:menaquinone-dependent protoporphyrinogen oxidase